MLGALGALLFPVACISESVSIKQKKSEYELKQIANKAHSLKNNYEYLLKQGRSPEEARITADIVAYHVYPMLVTPSERAQIEKYKAMGYKV